MNVNFYNFYLYIYFFDFRFENKMVEILFDLYKGSKDTWVFYLNFICQFIQHQLEQLSEIRRYQETQLSEVKSCSTHPYIIWWICNIFVLKHDYTTETLVKDLYIYFIWIFLVFFQRNWNIILIAINTCSLWFRYMYTMIL